MDDTRDKRRRGTKTPPPARRAPPPAATGLETAFIEKKRETGAELKVHMHGGDCFSGHIEYYDRDMIKIVPQSGPTVFIRKAQIRMIEEL